MVHGRCFACGSENPHGLGLVFSSRGDGSVIAECVVDEQYQGYPGVVQGGIVATILDCAMTNCLFGMGIEAMTVRLNIQFKKPVLVGERIIAEARLIRRSGRVHELDSRITQGGKLRAVAAGKFMTGSGAS